MDQALAREPLLQGNTSGRRGVDPLAGYYMSSTTDDRRRWMPRTIGDSRGRWLASRAPSAGNIGCNKSGLSLGACPPPPQRTHGALSSVKGTPPSVFMNLLSRWVCVGRRSPSPLALTSHPPPARSGPGARVPVQVQSAPVRLRPPPALTGALLKHGQGCF